MNIPPIPVKDLVLVGGGHAHVHTLRMMGMEPVDGVRVTLISRDVETPYSGMLPGHIADLYTREECFIDLGKLCSFAGVRLIHASVCHLDPVKKLLHCSDGRPPIRYDVVSIDIGISPKTLTSTEAGDKNSGITAVKPIDSFSERFDEIVQRAIAAAEKGAHSSRSSEDNAFRVSIVGGGAGGTELSFAINVRLRKELSTRGHNPDLVQVELFNRGKAICSTHNKQVSDLLQAAAMKKGIQIHNNTEISDVFCASDTAAMAGERYLISKEGYRYRFNEAIWCTNAKAQDWLKNVPGLDTTDDGFICVGPTLESTSLRNIYAVGDVAHLTHSPRPKAGVFAVRAGPPLTANLRARLLGQPENDWTPQELFLGIISTADGRAIASKGPVGIEGEFIWKLKDKIDREWMAMYTTQLPDKEQMMEEMAQKNAKLGNLSEINSDIPIVAQNMGQETIDMLSKAKMRCGGCGSKVGAQVLQRVLKKVSNRLIQRPEVISGPGDDAAIVKPPVNGEYSVHTIDYFRSFIGDPYIFGKIAAVHALSDVHAMNAKPITALALCVIPYGPESHVEDALTHVLAGAMDVLADEGCALVGGHTSEGAEMALGLSVNGSVNPESVFPKGPPEPGHVLILTKGLGTGTLLAADMRGKANGRWVANAIQSMVQSNASAASILAEHHCAACSDVTGFGLMGHLIEMLEYGDEDRDKIPSAARLSLGNIPTLLGATTCIEAGVFSSLAPENARSARAVDNVDFGRGKPQYPLLYDPQTSGGLLAAVPSMEADAVVKKLRAIGFTQTTVIGKVVNRSSDEFAPLIYLDP
jgi:selenide, water dikinase